LGARVHTGSIDPRRIRTLVLLLAACVALMMTGSGIVMPIFARRVDELGGGVRTLGWLSMSFALAQFLASPFMGGLADRFGRRPLVLVALAAFSLANVGFLFAPSSSALIAVRALGGVFTAGLFPASLGIIADMVPKEQQARWIGIVMGCYGLGLVAGPVLGGVLYDSLGYVAPFVASAAMAALAFVSALFLVPETRTAQVRRRELLVKRRQAQMAATSSPAAADVCAPDGAQRRFASLPRPLYLFFTLLGIEWIGTLAFSLSDPQLTFYIFNDLGWSTVRYGLVAGLYGLMMVLGQVLLGQLSDRLGRKPLIIAGTMLTASFYTILATVRAFPVLLLAAFIAGLGESLAAPARSAFYFDITPQEHRSRVVGLKGSAASLGGVVGPLLLVVLSEVLAPRGIFAVTASLLGVVVLVALTVLREPRHIAAPTEDVAWQVSNQRALAAQATLQGLVQQAVDARELRRGQARTPVAG
jgi:DHA1 family tetracycline resistance protein-like MFS transporter